MDIRDSRKIILDGLRSSRLASNDRQRPLLQPHHPDSSEYLPELQDLPEIVFARNLIATGGRFAYCQDQKELILAIRVLIHEERWTRIFCSEPPVRQLLDMAGISHQPEPGSITTTEVAFTGCEYLVARTGSVLVSSAQGSGRRIFAHTPVHVVIAGTSRLVPELHEALEGVKNRYNRMPSQITLITGPSRTADIEKTLVMGAHGPRSLYLFLFNDE